MVKLVRVSTCNLDQWSMDFDTNLSNICRSIEIAKKQGASFRTGPELEITGYGCEDHFLEQDTFMHAWESIATILKGDLTDNILCDIGMPVLHRGVRYNCRVFLLNRKVIFIRPKMYLANDGNYREGRWFTPWPSTFERTLEDHQLPRRIRHITGDRVVPFGNAIIVTDDTTVTSETCEELFTPNSPHIALSLAGAEIIANGSGSHHNLRKLDVRMDLIRSATAKAGGCYLYANQQGCDGGRLYYDGCSSIFVNGQMVAQGSQFSVYDVEVVTAVVDLDDIRSYRSAIMSRSIQAAEMLPPPMIRISHRMVVDRHVRLTPSNPMTPRIHTPEEEIAYGPACWMWDYLRRSSATGFLLPLSGGADSAATCALVGSMCQLVCEAIEQNDEHVIADVRRICGEKGDWLPANANELASRIMHTVYMGTSNSSEATKKRAADIAADIGTYHLSVNIDSMVASVVSVFQLLTGKTPQYKVYGGSTTENLALQNIQARLRMVFAYLCAQLFPWCRGRQGWLLVLGSANVDEALRGYLTKYDCSSADINPIGGISKEDLKKFLVWAADRFNYPSLKDVVAAPPTAELEPITAEYTQADEADMGMSYEELGIFGRLRKIYRCGPVSMYQKLVGVWTTTRNLSATAVAQKVKSFFYYYSLNRHKMTTLTPSYHAENYSPDDNRFDHRQFLYNTKWSRQFRDMEQLAHTDEQGLEEPVDAQLQERRAQTASL